VSCSDEEKLPEDFHKRTGTAGDLSGLLFNWQAQISKSPAASRSAFAERSMVATLRFPTVPFLRRALWAAFGDFGEGYLRFSVANSIENIEKALDRVGAWAKKNL
jgi:hypothetical protein